MDQFAKKVTLTLNEVPTCAQGAICPQYLVQVLDVQLPLVRTMTDRCQNIVITASQDLRPVDGQLEMIQITDYSHSVCGFNTPSLTTVTYSTSFYSRTGGGELKTLSLFQGDALKAAR